MSKRKNAPRRVGNVNKPTGAKNAKTGPARQSVLRKLVGKINFNVFMAVALWLFLYWFYGDMLRVAQQRSFFVWDSLAMESVLSQSWGWLYAVGRFMLLACRWPLLGSLLIAAMLMGAVKLLDGVRNKENKSIFSIFNFQFSILIPFAYFGWMFYKGLNMFYLREPSWIMTIPLITLVVCAVIYLVSRVARKSKKQTAPQEKCSMFNVQCLIFLILWLASAVMAVTYAQNDRLTCKMECLMMEQDWDGMVEVAKSASRPSRTVAAYYALALNQNGQMANELFSLPFQYPNAHLSRGNGGFDGGMDYVVIDCNFYAGLTRCAYHEAMEQNVLECPTIHRLKRMVQCAVIDRENALAEKLLAILKKAPFEGDFVEKYSEMLKDYNLVCQDGELASVIDLQPVKDSFEQIYREPLFLGYNIALTEAKSIRGLHNSLYACLYSKDMKAFGSRVLTMVENALQGGAPLPKLYEEAIIVENIKNLAALKNMRLSTYTLQEMKEFMGECFTKGEKLDPKQKAKEFEKYRGTYEYYYYFQNVPDENYTIPGEDEKGGVN
ncbi:MAG: hypothetical protein J5729_05850 [Bacteroidaceae bacterium]|nr:hypothetical protein [Bacteroidaceae bacterium]